MTRAHPPCPKCGAKAVPIILDYTWEGDPGELWHMQARGEVDVQPCSIVSTLIGGPFAWHCNACGHEFGKAS